MTVSSASRVSGPYLCNGSQVDFSFDFKVFVESDVRVVLATAGGVESDLELTSDYTVSLNADQDSNPGGQITTTTARASGYKITITSKVPNLQGVDLPGLGNFSPEVLGEALDRLTVLVQQVDSRVDRAILMLLSENDGTGYTAEELLNLLNAGAEGAGSYAAAAAASASAADASGDAAAASAAAAAASAASAASAAGMLDTTRIDVATASTVNLTSSAPNTRHIRLTGTIQVDGFTVAADKTYFVKSAGAFTLKNNAAVVTNTGADIAVDANASFLLRATAADTVEVLCYTPGTAVSAAAVCYGLFDRADPNATVFTKTGAGTANIKAGTKIDVSGTLVSFESATAITMPTLTAGTDYAIWVKDDATIQATTDFASAPGAGNWRKIGGFHYAPGGNAAAQAGGDTTPAINEYSFWDLKWRPACTDPRGMTLVADSFWTDIYFLGVDSITNGTSKYNVSISVSTRPAKIPTMFGGNGSSTYATMHTYAIAECLRNFGKRFPTYMEANAYAYGTTEGASSGGTDVPTTGVSGTGATSAWNLFTSKWGVIQSTGCFYIPFGDSGATITAGATATGRGDIFNSPGGGLFGGQFGSGASSGSRCAAFNSSGSPFVSAYSYLGGRGVSDHVCLL